MTGTPFKAEETVVETGTFKQEMFISISNPWQDNCVKNCVKDQD